MFLVVVPWVVVYKMVFICLGGFPVLGGFVYLGRFPLFVLMGRVLMGVTMMGMACCVPTVFHHIMKYSVDDACEACNALLKLCFECLLSSGWKVPDNVYVAVDFNKLDLVKQVINWEAFRPIIAGVHDDGPGRRGGLITTWWSCIGALYCRHGTG